MAEEEVCLRDSAKVKRPKKRSHKKCFYLTGCLFVLLLFAAVGVLITLLLVVGWQEPRVETSAAVIDGQFNPDLHMFLFKGIPYAEVPQRWEPPVPLKKEFSNKPIEAHSDALPCAQFAYNSRDVIGSEDCLYLNVYTPILYPEAPLSTLVFFHGGFLHWGSSSMSPYTPNEHTARELRIVVITVQYRLNVFGFLATEDGLSGNYGLLDMIEALRWVRENVKQFGGDPEKVTVAGVDASASLLSLLVTSPHLAHTTNDSRLFHQLWMISPASGTMATHQEVVARHRPIYSRANCSDHLCLKELSTADTLRHFYANEWQLFNGTTDIPMAGVSSLPLLVAPGTHLSLSDMKERGQLAYGIYNNISIIIGSTAQEITGMPSSVDRALSGRFERWSRESMHAHLTVRLGSSAAADAVGSLYDREANVSLDFAYASLVSDARFACSIDGLAASLATGASVYRYVIGPLPRLQCVRSTLAWVDSPPSFAFNGLDLLAVLGGSVDRECGSSVDSSDGVTKLRSAMHAWLRSGTVNLDGWRHMDSAASSDGSGVVAMFDQYAHLAPRTLLYNSDKCAYWQEHYASHAWRP